MTAARRRLAVLLSALAVALPTGAGPGRADGIDADAGSGLETIYRSYYDAEVLGYCGLGDGAAAAGHRREVADAVADHGVPRAALEQARMRAWADAYREWQNRGLGGFRAWCETEGRQAQERLGTYGTGQ